MPSSQRRMKGCHLIDLLQTRQPTKSQFSNWALLCIRQTKWGVRNGEFLLEAWDFEDGCSEPMSEPTLVGAMDKTTLTKLARACLNSIGRKDLAVGLGKGTYVKRRDEKTREGIGGGDEKREHEETEEVSVATGEDENELVQEIIQRRPRCPEENE